MKFLYDAIIRLYGLGIFIAHFFNKKAKLWVTGRRNWSTSLEKAMHNMNQPIWFHCASLGEFEQGRPLIEQLKNQYPNKHILITFFSPSGYEIRKNYPQANHVCYLPLDLVKNTNLFLDIVKPSLVIFVKYEFWVNFISSIKKRKIPLFLISGRFRNDQYFFKSYGHFFKKNLSLFDHFFVQNLSSKKLLNKHHISQVTPTGDTRMDRVNQIKLEGKKLPKIERFIGNSPCLIVGSSWSKDEQLIFKLFQHPCFKNWKLIIAPHEIQANKLDALQKQYGERLSLWSTLEKRDVNNLTSVLLIDTIGILSSIYPYGTLAFIGGGFGKAIHNTQEAFIHEIPVIFGPKFQQFDEAVDLVLQNGAFTVSNSKELIDTFIKLKEPTFYKDTQMVIKNYISNHLGATEKILSHLKPYLTK